MNDGTTIALISSIGFLILALSALVAHRPRMSLLAKSAVGWVGIFLLIAIFAGYRVEIGSFFGDLGARLGLISPKMTNGVVRIPLSDDGHFWVTAKINGKDHRMMIDSGATYTALSSASAEALGVSLDDERVSMLNTANGSVMARVGTINSISVGPLQTKDLDVVVAPNFGDTDVIGMNFLSRLGDWRVQQGVMVLSSGNPVVVD